MTDKILTLARAALKSGRYPEEHKRTSRLYDANGTRWIELLDEEATLSGIILTMERGAEAGLAPLTALYNICWYNDRPCLWGDVALALIQSHAEYGGMDISYSGTEGEDDFTATCTISRAGKPDCVRSFSWGQARKAKLDKLEHYVGYGQRMLMIRARSWAMRDQFSDVLNGLSIAEEQQDVEYINSLPDTVRNAPAGDGMDEFTRAALAARGEAGKPDFNTLKKGAPIMTSMTFQTPVNLNGVDIPAGSTIDMASGLISPELKGRTDLVIEPKGDPDGRRRGPDIDPVRHNKMIEEAGLSDDFKIPVEKPKRVRKKQAPKTVIKPSTDPVIPDVDVDAKLREAEARQERRNNCLTCGGSGTVKDPATTDPLDTVLCPDC